MKRAAVVAGVLGAIGAVASAALASGAMTQFLQAYLFAWFVMMGLTLGCVALTLFHHAIRGRWAVPVLRFLEAGASMVPLMALLFVPIVLGARLLYPWAQPDQVTASHVLQHRAAYLNMPFWLGRAVFYFALWSGFAWRMTSLSLRQDETGDASLAERRAGTAAFGMVVLGMTVFFAYTDWVMSLDPTWYSSIYGLIAIVNQVLSAVAFATLLACLFRRQEPLSTVFGPRLTRDLGNMLLTFTMMWAYLALSQYLIIFSANLPQEIIYYRARLQGEWWNMGTFLVIFQFFVPFSLLLSGRTKRTPGIIMAVAIWILLMRVLDAFWTIIPYFYQGGTPAPAAIYPMAAAALVGVAGIWLWAFFTRVGRHALVPLHQPPVTEVLEHA